MIRIFLDASVIIAGIGSKTGNSRVVLKMSERREIVAFVSPIILQEVTRNLKKKFPAEVLATFLKYLLVSNIKKVTLQQEAGVFKLPTMEAQKDVHVLAAAYKAHVDYLVTLDRKHLLFLKNRNLPFRIVTPRELVAVVISKQLRKRRSS